MYEPTLILSHETAKSYYLTLNPRDDMRAIPCMDDPIGNASATSELFELFRANYTGFGNGPREVMVPDRNLKRQRHGLITHVTHLEYPAGSFWKLRPQVYLASPELCFVQMASQLCEPQAIEFGINLCAKFYTDPKTTKPLERKPVTCADKIAAYIDSLDGRYKGISRAKHALKWVVDNTASRMETRCAILMHYSKCYGGAGFPPIEANYHVKPGRLAGMTNQDNYWIDGAWPDPMAGYEYLGEEEHPDLKADMRRIDELEALGWHLVVLDKRTVYNHDLFVKPMLQLARYLGKRFRPPADWRSRAIALRRDLGMIDPLPEE